MPTIVVDMEKESQDIIDALSERSSEKEGDDLIRYIYNQAIDDAANFIRDLAPKNPMQSSTLLAAEKEIRDWLMLR